MASRGRPRRFDRTAALQRALEVFWDKGYEGAALTDLTTAMGITSPPSFYAAFDSKESLFREAVDLYVATIGAPTIRALHEGKTARAALHAMLTASMEVALSAPHSGGCLLIVGVVTCTTPQAEPLRDLLRARRQTTAEAIRARLEKGMHDGDLPSGTDIPQLTAFYSASIQSLSLEARDGADRAALSSIIEAAMIPLDHPAHASPYKHFSYSR